MHKYMHMSLHIYYHMKHGAQGLFLSCLQHILYVELLTSPNPLP